MTSVFQKIKDYLWLTEYSVTDFSGDVGVTPSKLGLLLSRRKLFDEAMAKRAERATKGYVTAQQILDEQNAALEHAAEEEDTAA